MEAATVLVTAAGSIVAQGIIKSLKLANKSKNNSFSYRIVATDMSPLAAGIYRCDAGHLVPPVKSQDYIDCMMQLCAKNDVKAVFIGSDDELQVIAEAGEKIERQTGAKVLTSPPDVVSISRDKWKTYEFLRDNNLPCAPSSLPEDRESFAREFGFPLVVKPREGYGSVHFYIAKDNDEIKYAISAIEKAGWRPVIQKYLSGENEYTTGVTVDKNGRYVMSSISIYKIIKHGQTYKGFIDDFYDVRKSAEETAMKLGARGSSINVQSKMEGDKPLIFEINPRFSATCPMRAVAGVNEPDIVYRNSVLGEEIKIEGYRKLVSLRYWNEVYVPLQTYVDLGNYGQIQENDSFITDYF